MLNILHYSVNYTDDVVPEQSYKKKEDTKILKPAHIVTRSIG